MYEKFIYTLVKIIIHIKTTAYRTNNISTYDLHEKMYYAPRLIPLRPIILIL